jgi:hypothetical protein
MSRRILIMAAALGLSQVSVGIASAAEYLFVFQPLDAHFVPELAANRESLAAALGLLRDYGMAESLHFVLIGELPAPCLAAADCEARSLLKRRVESITAEMAALPDGARWVTQLQWQPIPLGPAAARVEGLQLRLRLDPPSVFSGQCPYQLQVTDPRLPPQLPTDDTQSGTQSDLWVSVRGLAAVPVSGAASMRVTAAVRNSGTVTAIQKMDDHDALLGSGSMQAQWTAAQLNWNADAAEVDIDSAGRSRDIGNVILPWDDAPAGSSSSDAAQGCRVHFVLRGRSP